MSIFYDITISSEIEDNYLKLYCTLVFDPRGTYKGVHRYITQRFPNYRVEDYEYTRTKEFSNTIQFGKSSKFTSARTVWITLSRPISPNYKGNLESISYNAFGYDGKCIAMPTSRDYISYHEVWIKVKEIKDVKSKVDMACNLFGIDKDKISNIRTENSKIKFRFDGTLKCS